MTNQTLSEFITLTLIHQVIKEFLNFVTSNSPIFENIVCKNTCFVWNC